MKYISAPPNDPKTPFLVPLNTGLFTVMFDDSSNWYPSSGDVVNSTATEKYVNHSMQISSEGRFGVDATDSTKREFFRYYPYNNGLHLVDNMYQLKDDIGSDKNQNSILSILNYFLGKKENKEEFFQYLWKIAKDRIGLFESTLSSGRYTIHIGALGPSDSPGHEFWELGRSSIKHQHINRKTIYLTYKQCMEEEKHPFFYMFLQQIQHMINYLLDPYVFFDGNRYHIKKKIPGLNKKRAEETQNDINDKLAIILAEKHFKYLNYHYKPSWILQRNKSSNTQGLREIRIGGSMVGIFQIIYEYYVLCDIYSECLCSALHLSDSSADLIISNVMSHLLLEIPHLIKTFSLNRSFFAGLPFVKERSEISTNEYSFKFNKGNPNGIGFKMLRSLADGGVKKVEEIDEYLSEGGYYDDEQIAFELKEIPTNTADLCVDKIVSEPFYDFMRLKFG